jgi:iron complex outermembrane receptor protein
MLAALFAAGPLYAQSGVITGSVASTEGRALAGATVQVAGSQARAVTGPDGRYTISGVGAGQRQVTATVIGHNSATLPVTVAAGQTATLDFRLSPAAISLESVVAIGYGERRIRDVTGSVAPVGREEFNTGRVVSADQLIRGKVAGVQVAESGEPGGGINIRIRGGTSVAASSEPLFVVDGVPLEFGGGLSAGRNPLNFINPDDIANITVLKDAASTAIYGSRGANGVIIIETRSGTRGGPQFQYTTSVSTSRVTRELDLLSADQFRGVVAERAPGQMKYLGTASTDWRRAVERDAAGQEHALSVSGAGESSNYRLSLGYLDQEGVLRGTNVERLSAALNFNQRLFDDRLSVRANLRGARNEDIFTPGAVLGAATAFDPTQPTRNGAGGWFEQTEFTLAPNNPLAELALAVDEGTTTRGIGSLEAKYRMPFLEELSGTVRLGFDVASSERRGFRPSTLQGEIENPASCDRDAGDPPCPTGTVSRSNPTENKGVVDAFLNYNGDIDRFDSNLEATVGYSYERFRAESPSFVARGLDSDLLGTDGVPTAAEHTPRIFTRENKLASFFGRVNYTFRDRYLLTLSVRRDGSSRFGPDNQWGTFPGAAVAWRIGEESFLDPVEWLSDLKLRGSWGVNGNQAITDYLWVSSYTYSDAFARVQFGDEFVTTIRPSAVDPNIRWEETTSFNLGLDYGLFDNRISGSLEYYSKDTEDLLFRIPVAAGTNLSNFVTTNIGRMKNRGFEASVNALVLDGGERGVRWNAGFNAAVNRNRLVSIDARASGGALRIPTGGISGGVGSNIQVLQPGHPLNSFNVYRHRRGSDGRPLYEDTNGDGTIDDQDLYEDLNGDGRITQDDRAPFESSAPKWILAASSDFEFRNLDLSFTLRANLGNHVYNNVASAQGFYNILNGASGPVNLHSSVLEYGFEGPQFFSDVYVEDASFLRMDNITLGYTIPRLRALSVQGLRVFGTVQNVFTLTGYDGLDPEAGLGGIDNTIYPRSRTFTVGASVGF